MKRQVVYIHGGESFLNHDDYIEKLKTIPLWHMETTDGGGKKWNRSLDDDLGDAYEVILPPMPNRENAKFEEWKIWFERHFEYFKGDVILIGCSLGAMFLAKYFSEYTTPFKPKTVFLMAGAYGIPGFNDKDCGDFLISPEKVRPVLDKAEQVVIMHSKDDFVVPFEHGEALAKALPEAEFVVYSDKNHFLVEEFPELVDRIRSVF